MDTGGGERKPGGHTDNRLNGVHTGSAENTSPASKKARPLDPDVHPWERQPWESSDAWEAFKAYRDSDGRKVAEHGPSAPRWSREGSWGYRAFEFDRYMDRLEVETQARYRRTMNERHRMLARTVQSKLVSWVTGVDLTRLSPTEAMRVLEITTRIERLAAGADGAGMASTFQEPVDAPPVPSLEDALDLTPEEEAALARQIHLLTSGD